jgi:hypothetical protein
MNEGAELAPVGLVVAFAAVLLVASQPIPICEAARQRLYRSQNNN